jgi:TonB family protein
LTLLKGLLLLLPPTFFAVALAFGYTPKTRDSSSLQSFYIVSNLFSDDLSSSFIEILNVEPNGNNTRAEVIRISSANRYCGGFLVRAAERTLTNTAPAKINGAADICAYTPGAVAIALKNAPHNSLTDPSDSSSETLVAECGTQQRIFEFPYPAEIDIKTLKRQSPGVFRLWDLAYNVQRDAFGKKFAFTNLPPEEERERQEEGTKSLSMLKSGKFQHAFNGAACTTPLCRTNYLAWMLRNYSDAPVNADPASVDLMDSSSFKFAKYEPPRFSPVAKTAHVQGEVKLSISADPETGVVKDVRLISGNPILGTAAVDAAKKWQFFPGSQRTESTEVTLKFDFHCDGE